MDEDGNQPGGDETQSRLGVTLLSVLGYLSQALDVLKLANQSETRKSLLGMLVEATRFSLDDQQRVEGGRKGYAGADRTRVSVGGGRTVPVPCPTTRFPLYVPLVSPCRCTPYLQLTDPQHGKPLDTAACILLAIGPHILMTHADVTATSSNSSKAPSLVSPSLLRSRALDFVTSDILTKAPKESVPAVESLMRYLCLHAPERAEGRAAAVEAVMKVYETVGRKEREGFFLFVGKLARVDRAAARVVALDLSAALVERMAMTWGRGVRGQGSMGSGAMEEGGGGGSRDGEGGDPGIEKGSGEAASGERGTESGREGGDGEGDKGDEVSLSQGSASEGDAHSGRESGNGTGVGNDSRESGDSSGNGSVRDVLISRVGGCLELMFRRASDASPTVRARALVALTATLRILKGRPSLLDAVLAAHAHAHAHAHAPTHPHTHAQAEPDASIGRGSGLSGESEPGEALGAGTGGSVLSVEEVLGMVRRRLEDEKGLVRKAAVGALEEIVGLSRLPLREELVDAIGELCSDSLLSVRRVALNALSKLTMSNPGHVWLRAKWLQSALVLILDNEATVQDQALDLLSSLLLQPLGLISASPRPSAASRMSLCKDRPLHVCVGRRGVPPAPVLCEGEGVCEVCGRAAGGEGAGAAGGGNAAAGEAGAPVVAEGSVRSVVAWLMAVGQGSSSVVPLLHRACAVLARRNALHARLVEGLQAVIEAAEGWQKVQQQQQQQQQQPNEKGGSVGKAAGVKGGSPSRVWRWVVRGAWLLLLEVTSFSPQGVRWEFLISRWRDGRKQQEARAARPESVSAKPALDHDAAESATPGFGSRDLGGQERGAGVLHGQVKEAEVLDGQEREAQVHVLKALCNVAARIPGEKAADVAAGLLHNLRSFQLSPEEAGVHMVALATLNRHAATGSRSTAPPVPVAAPAAATNPGTAAAAAKGAAAGVRVPVLAHGWLALGRFSLVDHSLAKTCVPLFVQASINLLLCCFPFPLFQCRLTGPPVNLQQPVRNNLVIILTDLCVRYTALVDPHVPCISACLRDPCELVRRQTLVLLAGLLQRDYVKWRGALVLRVLLCVVDESQAIREVALYLFTHVVPLHLHPQPRSISLHPSPHLSTSLHPSTGRRVPLVPYNIFIEALFALNACPFAPSSTTTAPPLPSSGPRPSSSSPPNPASAYPSSSNPGSSEAAPCDPSQPKCPDSSSPVEGIQEEGWSGKRRGRSGRGAGAGREGLDEELERFSLSGPSRHAARTTVYLTLLRLMAREHHLALSAKLCLQVLAPLLDGALPFSCPSVQAVVGDALDVLFRLGSNASIPHCCLACEPLPCQQVLAPLLDGALPLSCPSVQAVVGNALDVLSCKEMRPGSGKAAGADEDDGALPLSCPSVQAVVGDALFESGCSIPILTPPYPACKPFPYQQVLAPLLDGALPLSCPSVQAVVGDALFESGCSIPILTPPYPACKPFPYQQVLAPLLDGALPLSCPSVQAVVGNALDVLSCKEMRPGSFKAAGADEDDGALPLSCPTVQAVVGDALGVLSCKEMRPGSGKAAGAEEEGEEEAGGSAGGVTGGGGSSGGGRAGGGAAGGGAGALANALKGRVVTQLMKKNLVENTIPVLIELKRLLEARNSPLQGALMACLRCLFKEYKEEIEDLLAADPQLGKELVTVSVPKVRERRGVGRGRGAQEEDGDGVGKGRVGGGGSMRFQERLTREGGEVGGRGCESEVERMRETEEGESEEAGLTGGTGEESGKEDGGGSALKIIEWCVSIASCFRREEQVREVQSRMGKDLPSKRATEQSARVKR
ncbi:unnamed protein product [Closterium sp. Naga37s-1]|nr:unnamed protein product [Closterium sp. Naga37s-1]